VACRSLRVPTAPPELRDCTALQYARTTPTETGQFPDDSGGGGALGCHALEDRNSMTLNPRPSYPNRRTYVLKLHRDADATLSQLSGRLEHLATGRYFDFTSAATLLAHLMRELRNAHTSLALSEASGTVPECSPEE
jgi:hypothetical protein